MADRDPSQALRHARAQRADLWRHLVGLEEAISTPVPGRAAEWAGTVHDALVDLAATFERHIAVTEGNDGLFQEVVDSAPRLSGEIDGLRQEHDDISATMANELRALRAIQDATQGSEAAASRERLTALVSLLLRHRQAGADLVYEAYAVDIGVGD